LTTGDDLAFWQASNYQESEIILQVIPTAPFLRPETLSSAINLVRGPDVDSVAAVFKEVFYQWTEEGQPTYYLETALYPIVLT